MLTRYTALLALALLLSLTACSEPDDEPSKTNADTGRSGADAKAGAGERGGAGAAGKAAAEGGAASDPMLGNTGLRVSDVLGFYSGDWGDMILRKQDDEIWGAYVHDDGTITGKVDAEGVFVGWWSEVPSREPTNDAGDVEFRWARGTGSVVALDGRWRYGTNGDWHDDWDVDLVTDRSPPAALSERFSHPAEFKHHP
ncbi:MAG TPA: hypothetical protein VJV78_18235 [Polyangiales bacterium]|nr:hypothetical protein [Polyangiales bacterium]